MRRLAIAAALAAVGCSGAAERSPRQPKKITPPPAPALPGPFRAVEPPGGPGPGAGLPVVAARVFALGDTQLHHMYGKRGFAQSPFADRYARLEVAIRPAALDDGADLLLDAFLAERRARAPASSLVYMGDAADLSCTQEYDRFFAVMAEAGETRFLMLTSNHDGFYVGNYTQKADLDGDLKYTDMPDDWTRACAEPDHTDDHRLTRGRAIQRIAAVLPDAPEWATHHALDDVDEPRSYTKSYLAYARPLAGGDPGAPPAWGLFVDTSDYRDHDVRKTRGAGTVGSVSRDQLRALDHAAFEADAADPQTAWIAFGHHPLAELDRGARERFLAFLDGHPRVVAYVSAHTHFSDERTHTLPSGRKVVELVVGATGDFGGNGAPETAREIEIRIDPETGTAGVTSSRLELDVDALCDGIAAQRPGDPLGYTAYRINRDDTGDLPTGISMPIEALLHDLQPTRVHQTAGALLVEGKLVRSLAALYAEAPGGVGSEHAGEVQALIDAPFLPPAAQAIPLTAWETWIDPALHEVPAMTHRVHRFARHRALFEALRATRTSTPERRRYFTCHAARAAEAEAELAADRRHDPEDPMMRTRWPLVVALAACGPGATPKPTPTPTPIVAPTPPAPPVPKRVMVTVMSGSIDTRRAGDTAWDDVKKKPKATAPGVAGPLADYVRQHPELDGSLALVDDADASILVTKRAGDSAEPDPAVLIEIGDRVYRSPVRPGQLEPVWAFPFVVELADDDLVHISVIDWDDWSTYDMIGDKVVSGRELLAGAVLELPRFGMVGRVTLTIAPLPATEARHRVAVAGKPAWSETGVSLVAGQDVTILAAGEICSKGDDRSKCAGPEGQVRPAESNLPGFEAVGHAALVGQIGDTRFVIGRERRFIAPASGPLVLGINDRDASNNRGELEVSIGIR